MSVFQMSVSASVLILAIVIIRALAIHKLPKKTFLVLWGVVLLRLLIPFSFPRPFSTNTVVDKAAEWFAVSVNTQTIIPNNNVLPSANALNPIVYPTSPDVGTQISPILVVWVIGMVVCALFFLVTHLRCRREYKAALPIENDYVADWLQQHKIKRSVQIRQSDRISAPITYGLWKPVILFPKTADWQDTTQLFYVLTHELTHIKRLDILSKCLLAAALCVHWFNPLVWVMYVLANRDIELSCDENVVRAFGERTKSSYALTLIGLEERKSGFSLLYNHFAKNAIEERINAIMKLRKTTLFGTVLALVLVAGLIVGTMAVSAAAQATPDEVTSGQNTPRNDEMQQQTPNESSKPNDAEDLSAKVNVNGAYSWPVPDYYTITTAFGTHMHPIEKILVSHDGIDIPAPSETPILAANAGTIIEMSETDTYGYFIWLDHGAEQQTFYGHLYGYAEGLAVGDVVKTGDVIGYVGSTGEATGPHLHFGLSVNGEYINPIDYLATNDTNNN